MQVCEFSLFFSVVLAVPVAALASGPAKVYFEDTVPSGSSSSVTIQTHRAAAFKVLLRVPTAGRAKLFLLGKNAPKGGALIDTKTYACDGAAGLVLLQGVVRAAAEGDVHLAHHVGEHREAGPKMPAHVELTVRW